MPEQFARICVHTHPGENAQPSMTDEETFAEVFGSSTWAVMFILAEAGQTYSRLQTNVRSKMACQHDLRGRAADNAAVHAVDGDLTVNLLAGELVVR